MLKAHIEKKIIIVQIRQYMPKFIGSIVMHQVAFGQSYLVNDARTQIVPLIQKQNGSPL